MATETLGIPLFDADNHLYETEESLTKYLPERYKGAIDYVQVRGRTKIVVRGQISEFIPNPTFEVVARPGAMEELYRVGNPEGKSRREIFGEPMRAIPAFRGPEARLELMDEQGIDRSLMFPTLASLVEERMRDDPEMTHAVIHSLNEWLHETWTFNYENRIFPTPVIHLGIVDKAIEELEWVLARGARIVLIRPAPVYGFMGPRSPALPEFDPFWKVVDQARIPVGMHASDSGYQRYINEWDGVPGDEMTPFKAGSGFMTIVAHMSRPITDTVASLIGHGLCTRFPDLRFAPVENGSNWVRPLLHALEFAWDTNPKIFDENPVEAFKRNIYVHPFHEEDPIGLVDLLGADRVLFGSDYPHPEGMSDPISFVDELAALPHDDVAKIMGGNMNRLMHLEVA